jgi:hypothetical protein
MQKWQEYRDGLAYFPWQIFSKMNDFDVLQCEGAKAWNQESNRLSANVRPSMI